MDALTGILVALIASTPPTLAVILRERRTNHKLTRIDRAVNHQPDGTPTLVEKIDAIGTQVNAIDEKVDSANGRLTKLERKVG